MKNRITNIVCRAACLPLVLAVLFVRYGETEGNCRKQQNGYGEALSKGKEAGGAACRRRALGRTGRGGAMGAQGNLLYPAAGSGGEIHSISFSREWKKDREGDAPVTVVHIVFR